ncbi:MAG: hypothetical protein A3D31_10590 [Candidatus Fluviicola riflensis]|nr:MAG: hypothetical protein CHH17_15010 [Candidatus Fluviicola riflensis]OGS77446.1 MAG: hypothetical protein A3D31_10590 [Candidatus Fluviicola riflensis]OGS84026.1 MAG: hypothetical protein A3E30_11990 [Fluviicola sp. RIFCSPHIGHO2_12_FULL_43_24]OGS84513.1 MAG: hypothetical protein A2724_07530 [Fluviicola sp. RIFCSPHIGHO2_01_FULL_43_53]
MDRIRRFQRTLITSLVGINTFVFSFSNDFGIAAAILFTGAAILGTLVIIFAYILVRRKAKRVSDK